MMFPRVSTKLSSFAVNSGYVISRVDSRERRRKGENEDIRLWIIDLTFLLRATRHPGKSQAP